MGKLEIIYQNIENIKPYENNPRVNDDSVGKVAASIKEFGFKNPIILDKNNIILAGHTRHEAGQLLGLKTVPTITVDNIDEQQAKAFRIADNRTTDSAFWDIQLLEEIILDIQRDTEIDLTLFGFDKIEELDVFVDEGEIPNSGATGTEEEQETNEYEVVITCMDDYEIETIMDIFGFEEEGQKLKLTETKIYQDRKVG